MSKSLEFCIATASDANRSTYSDRDWNNAYEIDPQSCFSTNIFFNKYSNKDEPLELTGVDDSGKEINVRINLSFNPDADFQYFTSKSYIYDGTLYFLYKMFEEIASKVCTLQTYYAPIGVPHNGDTINIIVGNFVILDEFDEDGTLFTPKDKKWMRERTTVLLPIRMDKR